MTTAVLNALKRVYFYAPRPLCTHSLPQTILQAILAPLNTSVKLSPGRVTHLGSNLLKMGNWPPDVVKAHIDPPQDSKPVEPPKEPPPVEKPPEYTSDEEPWYCAPIVY